MRHSHPACLLLGLYCTRDIWGAGRIIMHLDDPRGGDEPNRKGYPRATACVQDDVDRMLPYFAFQKASWKSLRTTNPIESVFDACGCAPMLRHDCAAALGALPRLPADPTLVEWPGHALTAVERSHLCKRKLHEIMPWSDYADLRISSKAGATSSQDPRFAATCNFVAVSAARGAGGRTADRSPLGSAYYRRERLSGDCL